MGRSFNTILPLVLAASLCSTTLFAANVHLKGKRAFRATDQGLVLNCCVKIAGLGNEDVTIVIEADGFATASCINPGGNTAPGQNKVPVTLSGTETISADEIKNGTVTTCLTTDSPDALDPVEAGCPNGNWDAPVKDVEFSSVTVTVIQGDEKVLEKTFDL